jgi:hypothetical protein
METLATRTGGAGAAEEAEEGGRPRALSREVGLDADVARTIADDGAGAGRHADVAAATTIHASGPLRPRFTADPPEAQIQRRPPP